MATVRYLGLNPNPLNMVHGGKVLRFPWVGNDRIEVFASDEEAARFVRQANGGGPEVFTITKEDDMGKKCSGPKAMAPARPPRKPARQKPGGKKGK